VPIGEVAQGGIDFPLLTLYSNFSSIKPMETFLETSFQNVRSSKRTDEFHKVLLDEVLNANPQWAEYDWQYEYQLPVDGFGGTFDIDIAGFRDSELKVAILGKALNSNINKNIKNYANTSVGEAARLMYAPDIILEKVLFVSVLPRVAPRFNKAGEVQGFDDVLSAKERTKINTVLQFQYGGKVEAIDLFFDIDNVKVLTEFNTVSISNLDPLVLV
jgi:hypothetical protein